MVASSVTQPSCRMCPCPPPWSAAAKTTDLARRTKSGTPDWFMSYRAAEAEATTLRFWGLLVVPGLLQTEGYARAHEQSPT